MQRKVKKFAAVVFGKGDGQKKICMLKSEVEVRVFCKVIGYALLVLLVGLFFLAKCSEPTINEKTKMCVDECSRRGMFGVLEAPFPNSTRNTAANYTCKCY